MSSWWRDSCCFTARGRHSHGSQRDRDDESEGGEKEERGTLLRSRCVVPANHFLAMLGSVLGQNADERQAQTHLIHGITALRHQGRLVRY